MGRGRAPSSRRSTAVLLWTAAGCRRTGPSREEDELSISVPPTKRRRVGTGRRSHEASLWTVAAVRWLTGFRYLVAKRMNLDITANTPVPDPPSSDDARFPRCVPDKMTSTKANDGWGWGPWLLGSMVVGMPDRCSFQAVLPQFGFARGRPALGVGCVMPPCPLRAMVQVQRARSSAGQHPRKHPRREDAIRRRHDAHSSL